MIRKIQGELQTSTAVLKVRKNLFIVSMRLLMEYSWYLTDSYKNVLRPSMVFLMGSLLFLDRFLNFSITLLISK